MIASKASLKGLVSADGRMPLRRFPALVFQQLDLQNATAVARELQVSAA